MGALMAIAFAAFLVALASAFFSVAEWIALLRFSGWAYGIGPHVLRDKAVLQALPDSVEMSLDTEHGEFKRTAEEAVFFRPRTRGLSILDAFAVAGTVRWDGEEAAVDGRLPLSTVLFVSSWLVGWSAIVAVTWIGGGNRFVVLGLAAVVPLVIAAVSYLVVPMEVRRARRVVDELRVRLSSDSSK
jgi:hypothetical protein